MNKIPKLRFPEFSGEWEENKNDIKIISGNTYPLEVYSKKGILLIQGLNIYPGKLILDNPTYISPDYLTNHQLIKKYDILMGLNRPIINNEVKVCQFNEEFGYLYQRAGILKFDESIINKKFLYQYLRTPLFKKSLDSELVGSDQPYIKSDLFEKTDLFFPNFSEQEEIASFLSSVDSKIDKLERKKELWEQYKKGMMQKIFSQELRFKSENGEDYPEWEEKSLGEVCEFSKGKGISKNDISDDGIECIRYGQLYTTYGEKIEKVFSKTNLSVKDLVLSKENDIIIPSSGETAIDLATASCIMDSGVAIGGDINILRTEINGVFLSYYLNNKKKREIADMAQGISVMHLYSTQLKTLKITIPSLPEQTQIADFLSSLDSKIEIVEKELLGMNEFKKGLLQKMFV